MDDKEYELYCEYKKQKEQKEQYLNKYGFTEKQKLNKIIDLLDEILKEFKNAK